MPETPIETPDQGGEPKPATTPEPSWRDSLPEKIRGEKTLSKFKDAGALAESYINLEKYATGGVRIPGPDAKPDEVAAFREKLGVPKDAAGYEIKYDSLKIPEGLRRDLNAESLDEYLAWAHENGFTRKQVEAMFSRFEQRMQDREQASEQTAERNAERAREQALTAIQKEWGDDAVRNLALVQRGVQQIAGDEYAVYLEETGLGNDPRHLRFLYRVFAPMVEDSVVRGGNPGQQTNADAKAEIKRLMASPEYQSKDRNVRLPVIERIRELTELAHAE